MNDNPTITLSDAIAAARAGRREEATDMLRRLTADDPFNADAWVWLGGIATDPREQRAALEQALMLKPDHARAQQGLEWLRQNHPHAFDAPAAQDGFAPATVTPDESHARVYDAPAVAESSIAPTYAAQSDAIDSRAAAAEAPTRAMPVFREPATDRMAVAAPVVPPASTTDRMAAQPAPLAPADITYRRSTGAEIARWLLALLWLAGLGAAATLSALTYLYPERFESLVNGALAPYNLQLVPDLLRQTILGTVIGLVVLAIVDAIVAMGLIARRRWAWAVNLLAALLVTAGTLALWVAWFRFTPGASTNTVLSPLGSPLLGLSLFTLIYLILSFASRRAFFRRPVEPSYER